MFFYREAQNIPSIVQDGLVLNLDAGNISSYPGTGTTWTDLSTNGNNGTLINGVGYSSNNSGVLTFDGIDDYVSVANNSLLNPGTGSFTFGCFVKVKSDVSSGYTNIIFTKNQTDFTNGYRIDPNVPYDGKYSIIMSEGSITGVNRAITESTITASLNTWNNIVGVWDAPNKKLHLYFNGIYDGFSSTTNSLTVNPTNNLEIARYNRLTLSRYEFSNIDVSQVLLYNRALTENEVQQNFNALRGRYNI